MGSNNLIYVKTAFRTECPLSLNGQSLNSNIYKNIINIIDVHYDSIFNRL